MPEKTMRDYVLIEQFLRGIEIGVDGYVKNGRVCFIAPHGKFTFRSEQTTVPIGHFFPFQGGSGLLQDIRTQIQLAVDASGLDNSCFNADVFVDGNHSYIIRMGGRCGATCIPELISSFYGFDYYQQILRGALGEETRFPEQAEHAAPCMAKLLISPQSGILTEVDNAKLDHLRSQGIRIQIDYPVGWRVHAITDGTDRIGSVIADTQDEAVFNHILQEVQECIRINGVSLEIMERLKKFIPLHLTIMLFSLTGVFSKAASVCYDREGLRSPMLYLFLFLMLLNCGVYAIAWQKVIAHLELNVAYANREVYMVWSQVWAVLIFHERLSVSNMIGLLTVMAGVWMVVMHE